MDIKLKNEQIFKKVLGKYILEINGKYVEVVKEVLRDDEVDNHYNDINWKAWNEEGEEVNLTPEEEEALLDKIN